MHNDFSILINRGLIYDLPPQCVTRFYSCLPISNPIKLQTNKTSGYLRWFFASLCRVVFDRDLKVNPNQNLYLQVKSALVGLLGKAPFNKWTPPAVQSLLKQAPIWQAASPELREVRTPQRKLSNYPNYDNHGLKIKLQNYFFQKPSVTDYFILFYLFFLFKCI